MVREANAFVLVHKQIFTTPRLDLDIGVSIPVTVGYETYGRLSPAHDNAILICHSFSGTSHAAGAYHPDDEIAGWWDSLIGPGKAFDTDRYFVICADGLCAVQARDPKVVTTGPASLDPVTGRPYGTRFPQVTVRDQVRLQAQLIASLGIQRLAAVAGPGNGGFQALEWAVTYPHVPRRVIAVATSHVVPPVYALTACQAAARVIEADPAYAGGDYYPAGPRDALARAELLRTSLARSDAWVAQQWARKTAPGSVHPWADRTGRYAFENELAEVAARRSQTYDANHFLYTARSAILHDIGYGNGGLDGAARQIEAEVLMLAISTDLQFPAAHAQELVDAINLAGGRARLDLIHSVNGHAAAITEATLLAEPIVAFLNRNHLH